VCRDVSQRRAGELGRSVEASWNATIKVALLTNGGGLIAMLAFLGKVSDQNALAVQALLDKKDLIESVLKNMPVAEILSGTEAVITINVSKWAILGYVAGLILACAGQILTHYSKSYLHKYTSYELNHKVPKDDSPVDTETLKSYKIIETFLRRMATIFVLNSYGSFALATITAIWRYM